MAKELKGSKTEANLQAAFAGESQARNKYTYYASKAKKEGYVQIAALFEETAALSGKPKKAANWLIGETLRLLREKNMDPEQLDFSPEHLAALIRLAEDGSVNNQVAKKVFEKIFEEDIDPVAYVEEHGLKTVSDTGMLEEAARRVIAANADAVEQYHQGKEKILGFLIGQLMRETKGQADPSLAGEILRSLL